MSLPAKAISHRYTGTRRASCATVLLAGTVLVLLRGFVHWHIDQEGKDVSAQPAVVNASLAASQGRAHILLALASGGTLLIITLGGVLLSALRRQKASAKLLAAVSQQLPSSVTALQSSEASLQQAQRIGGMGSYTVDIASASWQSSDTLDTIFGINVSYVRKGIYLAVNPMYARLLGRDPQNIVGQRDTDLYAPELAATIRATDLRALHSDHAVQEEMWLSFAADGRRALFDWIKTPVRDDAGQLLGVLGIGMDAYRSNPCAWRSWVECWPHGCRQATTDLWGRPRQDPVERSAKGPRARLNRLYFFDGRARDQSNLHLRRLYRN